MTGASRLDGIYRPPAGFAGHAACATHGAMLLVELWGMCRRLWHMAGS
jgi:hypothetical protein